MPDEFTPTTDQIRAHYAFDQGDRWKPERKEDFDRWLAEHDATVLESARNRLNGHDPAGEQLQRMADEKREG